ncbi:MAG: sugar-binding protein [Leeuwenhoekiella sp.]
MGVAFFISCQNNSDQPEFVTKDPLNIRVTPKATIEPILDGKGDDPAYGNLTEYPIDQLWLGEQPKPEDFTGSYKVTWTPEGLFILVTITDDVFYDYHPDPLNSYWDDDCLEIFVDADNSGGDHRHSYNAFAYHIGLDGIAIDLADDGTLNRYENYIKTKTYRKNMQMVWEIFVPIYNEDFCFTQPNAEQILKAGDKLGLAIAYCDNDGGAHREHFIGSVPIAGKDKNRAWIDAGIFGTLSLVN